MSINLSGFLLLQIITKDIEPSHPREASASFLVKAKRQGLELPYSRDQRPSFLLSGGICTDSFMSPNDKGANFTYHISNLAQDTSIFTTHDPNPRNATVEVLGLCLNF